MDLKLGYTYFQNKLNPAQLFKGKGVGLLSDIRLLHFHPLVPAWTCSFLCHFNSTESIQSCSHFSALNLSYTLPSLSYQVLIFSEVKHFRIKCLAQGHSIETMSQYWERRNMICLPIFLPSRIWNSTVGNSIDKALHSNHCARSLSVKFSGQSCVSRNVKN